MTIFTFFLLFFHHTAGVAAAAPAAAAVQLGEATVANNASVSNATAITAESVKVAVVETNQTVQRNESEVSVDGKVPSVLGSKSRKTEVRDDVRSCLSCDSLNDPDRCTKKSSVKTVNCPAGSSQACYYIVGEVEQNGVKGTVLVKKVSKTSMYEGHSEIMDTPPPQFPPIPPNSPQLAFWTVANLTGRGGKGPCLPRQIGGGGGERKANTPPPLWYFF